MKKARRNLGNPVGVKNGEGYIFLIPILIPYFIFTFSMLVVAFVLSFTDYSLLGDTEFVGFKNYVSLFNDANYGRALKHTMVYVFTSTPIMLIIPFLMAYLINTRQLRARAFFRATFFHPQVIAVSVITVMASYIFQPYTGLINGLLQSVGILPVDHEILWLTNRNVVWITIMLVTIWRSTGYNMIIYLAGMQDIPDTYYEAADIEGATEFQQMVYITMPCLSNIHVLILFLQLISSFKIFSQIFLLTQGGPSGATKTYIQYLYETAFTKWLLGKGSAAAIVLFVIILTITQIQMKLTQKYSA